MASLVIHIPDNLAEELVKKQFKLKTTTTKKTTLEHIILMDLHNMYNLKYQLPEVKIKRERNV